MKQIGLQLAKKLAKLHKKYPSNNWKAVKIDENSPKIKLSM